jgi:hypothetical protein
MSKHLPVLVQYLDVQVILLDLTHTSSYADGKERCEMRGKDLRGPFDLDTRNRCVFYIFHLWLAMQIQTMNFVALYAICLWLQLMLELKARTRNSRFGNFFVASTDSLSRQRMAAYCIISFKLTVMHHARLFFHCGNNFFSIYGTFIHSSSELKLVFF